MNETDYTSTQTCEIFIAINCYTNILVLEIDYFFDLFT